MPRDRNKKGRYRLSNKREIGIVIKEELYNANQGDTLFSIYLVNSTFANHGITGPALITILSKLMKSVYPPGTPSKGEYHLSSVLRDMEESHWRWYEYGEPNKKEGT